MVFRSHAPNEVQSVSLSLIEPNDDNCRKFVEDESLEDLEAIYREFIRVPGIVLPDPPVLRYLGPKPATTYDTTWTMPVFHDGDNNLVVPRLRLLAGERRVVAARRAGLKWLPCRIVTLTDEEAYLFLLRHNNVARMTVAELAAHAADMDRLGFTHKQVETELTQHTGYPVSAFRYVTVGKMIPENGFTDTKKLCDPSILLWFDAAKRGKAHFEQCFHAWDLGLWKEKDCDRNFRLKGKALPRDATEKGFRIVRNLNRLTVRGTIDLDLLDPEASLAILEDLEVALAAARKHYMEHDSFGAKNVILINPETVDWA